MEGKWSKELVGGRELLVYLPPSYAEGERRYPVVYLHDGGQVAKDGLNYAEHLFLSGRLPEMIFVGVRPHNRNDEYTPWPAGPVASRAPSFGGGGPRYISELAQQLKPFVDRTFHTMPEPEHTGLAGCSLGGLISLYAYYGYPALFGKIALLSASFWFEGVLDDVRGRTVGSAPPRLFLSVGSLEGAYKRNVQRSMAERTVAVHAALLERGWPSERLKLEVEAEGTHDAMFFARKFPEALIWLFSGEGEHAG